MYQKPISEQTTQCLTATALGSAVIGVLFEKRGSEIRAACKSRLVSIDAEFDRLKAMLDPLLAFIVEKEKSLDPLRELEHERRLHRAKTLTQPREMMRLAQIALNDATAKVDEETSVILAKEDKKFKEGWDQFRVNEFNLNRALEGERLDIPDSRTPQLGAANRPMHTPTATATTTGTPKPYDYESNSGSEWSPTISDGLQARINRHKELAGLVAERLRALDRERRELMLLGGHVDPKRSYKLTLSQLSAFGFEDKPVKE